MAWIILICFVGFKSMRHSSNHRLIPTGFPLYVVSFFLIIVLLSAVVPEVGERIDSIFSRISQTQAAISANEVVLEDNSLRSRTWAASVLIIRDNLFNGVGVSSSFDEMIRYGAIAFKGGEEVGLWVHGGFLKIALYAGLIALVPFLFFLGYCAKKMLDSHKGMQGRRFHLSAIPKLGIVYILCLIPINIGADYFGYSGTWLLMALLVSFSAKYRHGL